MRKRTIAAAGIAVIILSAAPAVQAGGWGIGGFAGSSIPVVQDDAEKGIVFGAHLRMSLGGVLGIEPNIMFFRNGDWEFGDAPGELFDGSKMFAIGINAILGGGGPVRTGFRPYFVGGVRFYNEKNDFRDYSDGSLGWNAGLGFEVGAGPIGIDVRASGELLPLERGGSRKWVHLRGGLNYYFGI